MSEILMLFIIAAVVEAVWEALKPAWPDSLRRLEKERGIPVDSFGALVLSVIIATAAGTDLLQMVGVPLAVPYLGTVLTGVLISRGSNFVHDLLGVIDGIRQDKKPISIDSGM